MHPLLRRAVKLALVGFPLFAQCESFIHQQDSFIGISTHQKTNINRISLLSDISVVVSRQGKDTTSSSRLFNSDNDESESEKSSVSSDDSSSSPDTNKLNIGQTIGFGILTAFGYFVQGVGWLVSAGLVLNIFGYGYQFNREEGMVHIDTLQRIRTDNQFKAEYERMGRDMDLKSKQQRNFPTTTMGE